MQFIRYKYLKIWAKFAHASFQESILLNPFSSFLFIVGKLIRFGSFFIFLLVLIGKTATFLSFTREQVVVFYLIYNLVDVAAQAFFRGVYWFRGMIVSGIFDHFLLKPIHPLFNVLTRYTDFMDVATLIPLVIYTVVYIIDHRLAPHGQEAFAALILLGGSMVIAFCFHVLSMAVGVITTEVDSIIWMFRNLTQMARLPIDIYTAPVRLILTFILPVGVMITFPAKALFGLLAPVWIVVSVLISGAMLLITLSVWRKALEKYTSASS